MASEEKAREIARINQEYYETGSCRCVSSEEECYDSAMEMAKWKVEEIKNKIEQFFSEHDDYVDMDRLKNELIKFIGL